MYKVTLINSGVETVIHHHMFNDLKLSSGELKERRNLADGFTFSLLPNNPGYDKVYPLKTLVRIENTIKNVTVFEGRVLRPTDTMNNQGSFTKSYVCESELGYLNDSRQRHGEYHDITVRDFLQVIIDNHNADVADDPIDKTFEIGFVDVDSSTGTLYRYLGYGSTFDEIEDKLISRLGGEIRIRKENGIRYLDYMQELGEVKNTPIRLAKNLQAIRREIDPTSLITRLIPLGERIDSEDDEATDASQARLTIESVNDGKDYIVDEDAEQAVGTIVVSSEVWDDITQPNILKTRGEQFLQEHNKVKASYEITALDLSLIGLDTDSFELYNWYPVINPIMNINEHLRIIEKDTDVLDPENSYITVGDTFLTASDYQKQSNRSQKKVIELESTVERQSERLFAIRQELESVDDIIDQINDALGEADIPALEDAISNLNQAVSNLTDAIDNIPDYGPATETTDGLMSKEDKVKLNLIEVLNEVDLDDLVVKLDLITVTEPVDLDDLLQRVEALENG